MRIKLFQVDAFTNKPFRGNPAAVCILPEPRNEEWMQDVAREMNLSETAFLWKRQRGFDLRWFTPRTEVDLCGHATLASAHVLWESGYLGQNDPASFFTKSGLLTCERKGDWIEMNFPEEPEERITPPDNLIEALGVEPIYVGRNRYDYLVEVGSEKTVRDVKPDYRLLGTIPVRGVMVTSLSDSGDYDFVSRFFAPASGIDEDPATGSAHCCLGPFWKKRLEKNEFLAFQASGGAGVIKVRLHGGRVYLGGQAVTVFRGELV